MPLNIVFIRQHVHMYLCTVCVCVCVSVCICVLFVVIVTAVISVVMYTALFFAIQGVANTTFNAISIDKSLKVIILK